MIRTSRNQQYPLRGKPTEHVNLADQMMAKLSYRRSFRDRASRALMHLKQWDEG
jgi:hypothetical protein